MVQRLCVFDDYRRGKPVSTTKRTKKTQAYEFLVGLLLQGWLAPNGIKEKWFIVLFFAMMAILMPLFGYLEFDTWQAELSP